MSADGPGEMRSEQFNWRSRISSILLGPLLCFQIRPCTSAPLYYFTYLVTIVVRGQMSSMVKLFEAPHSLLILALHCIILFTVSVDHVHRVSNIFWIRFLSFFVPKLIFCDIEVLRVIFKSIVSTLSTLFIDLLSDSMTGRYIKFCLSL